MYILLCLLQYNMFNATTYYIQVDIVFIIIKPEFNRANEPGFTT